MHRLRFDREQDAVKTWSAAVQEIPDRHAGGSGFRSNGHRWGISARLKNARSMPSNHRSPVKPTVLRNQPVQNIEDVAFSLRGDFNAKSHTSGGLRQERPRLHASCRPLRHQALSNRSEGFIEFVLIEIERCGQNLIEGSCRVLAMPGRIRIELRFSLNSQRNQFHGTKLRGFERRVKLSGDAARSGKTCVGRTCSGTAQ